MEPDFWAEAYDPLEMLNHLRDPSPRYSDAQRGRHNELLNTYTVRCLVGIGADSEADLFRDHAFGSPGDSDDLTPQRTALEARVAAASYSLDYRPYRIPPDSQRARAALAALDGLTVSAWTAAGQVTWETRSLGEHCAWLRCLFPNPLGPSGIERAWLTSTVIALATGIFAEQAFDRMPILADALQDAGCDNERLLHHCRHDAAHGMHCWALDALLARD